MIPQAEELPPSNSTEIISLLTKVCEGCQQPFAYVIGSHFKARNVRRLCESCAKARDYAKSKAWKAANRAKRRAESCVSAKRHLGPTGNPHAICACNDVRLILHDEQKMTQLLCELERLEANWENQTGEETLAMTSDLLARLDQLEQDHPSLKSVKASEQSALAKLRTHPLIAQIWAEENPSPLSAEVQRTRDYFLRKQEQKANILRR